MSEEVFVCQEVEPPPHVRRFDMRGKEQPPKHDPKPGEPAEHPHEPEPEQDEPQEPKEEEAVKTLAMSMDQLERLIREVRKPVIDEQKIAQQKRTREHNRQMIADNRKMQVNRFYACNHMQLPGSVMSGCAAIAWATQSDGRRRGVCQHCGTVFSSERNECASDEIWQAYKMLVRLPTHPSGNINNVFQSA